MWDIVLHAREDVPDVVVGGTCEMFLFHVAGFHQIPTAESVAGFVDTPHSATHFGPLVPLAACAALDDFEVVDVALD